MAELDPASRKQLGKPPGKNDAPKELVNSLGMKLALIPAGRFTMGAPSGEKHRRPGEAPQHSVQIKRPFYMGVYEVTQAEFKKVMGSNPSLYKKVEGQDTSRFPVENVQYPEAVQFCEKLSELDGEKQAGRTYRLPTEAEWEYACRAGSTTVFTHGPKISSTDANFNGWHPYGGADRGPYIERPTTVGSYKPNAFGLYDMHGNVFEWVLDWFDVGYYAKSEAADPKGPAGGKFRVLRGGSWQSVGSLVRSAERYYDRDITRHEDHGFRVVATIS
jgi:formylglycine-generating enzyme required for sulfatase activity